MPSQGGNYERPLMWAAVVCVSECVHGRYGKAHSHLSCGEQHICEARALCASLFVAVACLSKESIKTGFRVLFKNINRLDSEYFTVCGVEQYGK